ncbi:MAG: gamma-glutamylputrescine oxidoreductase [Oceanospirillaceae bacterium]|uniref:NAD(P)/FAD-dependent oxidoreductase n=1 Tax=unclassified Thalassolituus TaxID=2624967 RepID=UPI000C43AD5B|nr:MULTISPECIES: FAD-binding oxidoreductase [unclassified Thalassolituus]MAX99121.1 gamma-glutamylputrescine oxidoreductase [Oceanospirillaceae bacterium]MBL36195.1 gamma-glutamylputrescine oxidoreductase [Oceanospirillaceae bacterium]MBS55095.1 gamma-glutamylputrescine oxidoreductase [Oceanospirillaceae bacterium]|tara:strand:+ start:786 stop:2075 length:1290 start_codon:yes stop_codon:yes gene_type:complete
MNSSYPSSYYAASANRKTARPALAESLEADVCVIGAGFTGLSSALHLAERGYSVVVLEGSRIGFGASGRNGGQIVHSYSRDMDFIENHYGTDTANAMGSMAFEGGKIIRRLVKQYDIQCDLKDGGIFASCNQKQFRGLQHHKALWEKHGNDQLELLDAKQVQDYIGTSRYTGALLDKSGGHIHPLNLTLGEADAIESLGGKIFEDSPVTFVEQGENPLVKTAKGQVRCKYVMIATNAYVEGIGNIFPQLTSKSMPCGTQVITTEPLSEAQQKELLPQDYCVEDSNYLLDYYRLSGEGRLIYGGGVTYGAREPGKIESLIRPKMLKTFPQLKDVKIDYAWTGNFLLTLMRLPQFGRVGNNIFYAQGYSGHGVTSTHLAGELVASAIQGHAERFDVFAGLPQYPFPGGRMLRVPYTAIGAFYYDLRDKLGI